MSAHPFRDRVDGHVDAIIETAAQIGRIEGGVDHEGDVAFPGDLGDGLQVHDVETGVADQLAVDQSGLLAHRRAEAIDIGRIDECRRDAEAGQRILHQADVAAVHL